MLGLSRAPLPATPYFATAAVSPWSHALQQVSGPLLGVGHDSERDSRRPRYGRITPSVRIRRGMVVPPSSQVAAQAVSRSSRSYGIPRASRLARHVRLRASTLGGVSTPGGSIQRPLNSVVGPRSSAIPACHTYGSFSPGLTTDGRNRVIESGSGGSVNPTSRPNVSIVGANRQNASGPRGDASASSVCSQGTIGSVPYVPIASGVGQPGPTQVGDSTCTVWLA